MGEEIKAPKMLSSVSLMHKSVGPLVFVEQILQQVIYIPNEKWPWYLIPVQVCEAVPMRGCGEYQAPVTARHSSWQLLRQINNLITFIPKWEILLLICTKSLVSISVSPVRLGSSSMLRLRRFKKLGRDLAKIGLAWQMSFQNILRFSWCYNLTLWAGSWK